MGEKRLKGDKKHTHSECITLRCAPSNDSTLKKKKKKKKTINNLTVTAGD
jgi:hypothetical protein